MFQDVVSVETLLFHLQHKVPFRHVSRIGPVSPMFRPKGGRVSLYYEFGVKDNPTRIYVFRFSLNQAIIIYD